MKRYDDKLEYFPKHIEGCPHVPYQTLRNKQWGWVVEVDCQGRCIEGFSKIGPEEARTSAERLIAKLTS